MNNKTKDILDEVLDVEESTTEFVEKNQTLSLSKEMKLLKMLMNHLQISKRKLL